MEYLKYFKMKLFNENLINWYLMNKRELPWRKTNNPYFIWISEIMCQQTKINTVIPYYLNFIEKFPTVELLAQAKEEEVLKAWEGLGYYSRARNIHTSAKMIVKDYNGVFPDKYESIASLKGIGSYTAGAISSIAFNIPKACVDGNVMRVMSRVLKIEEDISLAKTKRLFEDIVNDIIDPNDPSSFNQGLMELGALICTPTSQKCGICPVNSSCSAYLEGVDHLLPVKSQKAKQKEERRIIGFILDEKNRILMHKRPNNGLLGGLWEFPHINGKSDIDLRDYFKNHNYLQIKKDNYLGNENHVFSHLIWNMELYQFEILNQFNLPDHMQFFMIDELESIPIATAHKKLLKYLCYNKK